MSYNYAPISKTATDAIKKFGSLVQVTNGAGESFEVYAVQVGISSQASSETSEDSGAKGDIAMLIDGEITVDSSCRINKDGVVYQVIGKTEVKPANSKILQKVNLIKDTSL